MTTTPPLNGQVIGQAHYATRAILDRHLARAGVTFHQSVALNATVAGGGAVAREWLVERMTGSMKIDEWEVLATLAQLTDAGLAEILPAEEAEEPDELRIVLTEAGRALQARLGDAVAGIAARLYRDVPADELATAGRVLTLVTDRANAELSASGEVRH